MPLNPDMVGMLRYWMAERECIRIAKERGDPKPWTDDPILQQFKFCNVRREDDRVTRWFKNNWRAEKYWAERNFVPAIILGRTINWPDTLEHIGFPHVWDEKKVYAILEGRKATGLKVYTGAYMVTQYGSTLPKNQLVTENAGVYFHKVPTIYPTLAETCQELTCYAGVGPFMAGQVLADLKQTSILRHAKDWFSWAVIGPGSTRGLNRLYDRSLNYQMNEDQGLEEMCEVADSVKSLELRLCLQDVQNCLCEFDKYMRTKLGQGVPRSRYDGYGA